MSSETWRQTVFKILILGNGLSGSNLASKAYQLFGKKYRTECTYFYNFENRFVSNLADLMRCQKIEKAEARCACCYFNINPDLILSCSWAYKVPSMVVEAIEAYNFHPSLLPLHKKKTYVQQNLKPNDITGITMHRMNEHFDEGPIYKQIAFNVEKPNNKMELLINGIRATNQILLEFVNEYPDILVYPQEDIKNV